MSFCWDRNSTESIIQNKYVFFVKIKKRTCAIAQADDPFSDRSEAVVHLFPEKGKNAQRNQTENIGYDCIEK